MILSSLRHVCVPVNFRRMEHREQVIFILKRHSLKRIKRLPKKTPRTSDEVVEKLSKLTKNSIKFNWDLDTIQKIIESQLERRSIVGESMVKGVYEDIIDLKIKNMDQLDKFLNDSGLMWWAKFIIVYNMIFVEKTIFVTNNGDIIVRKDDR